MTAKRVTLTYHREGTTVGGRIVARSGWRVTVPGVYMDRTHLVACHNDPQGSACMVDVDGPDAFPDVFVPGEDVEVEVAAGASPPPVASGATPWHQVQLDTWGNMSLVRSSGERFAQVGFADALGDALQAADDSTLWIRRTT